MGVLQGFFQICLVLTAILFVMNITLVTFGHAMTGEPKEVFLGMDTNMSVNPSNPITFEGTSIWSVVKGVIKQVTTEITEAVIDITGWDSLNVIIGGFVNGWNVILTEIFVGELLPIRDFLWLALNVVQVIGAAYLPFAVLSAWKGGGSP